MKKIYTEELLNKQFAPKESTISFILNYSKSVEVVKNEEDKKILFNLN
ncbi:hypothetical protein [Aureibaculum conchae]